MVEESLLRIKDFLVRPRNSEELPPLQVVNFRDQLLDLFGSLVQTLEVEVVDQISDEVLAELFGPEQPVEEIDADGGVELLKGTEALLEERAWKEELLKGDFLLERVLAEVEEVELVLIGGLLSADEEVPFLLEFLEEELKGPFEDKFELLLVASVFSEAFDFEVGIDEVLFLGNFEDEILAPLLQALGFVSIDFVRLQELHYHCPHFLSLHVLFFLLLQRRASLEGEILELRVVRSFTFGLLQYFQFLYLHYL